MPGPGLSALSQLIFVNYEKHAIISPFWNEETKALGDQIICPVSQGS